MSIKKEKFGMYSATIHYHKNILVFFAATRMGAFKSASRFIWGAQIWSAQ